MICCRLTDTFRFEGLPPRLRRGLDWLSALGPAGLPDGRYEIEGDGLFAVVQRYTTAPAAAPKFEAHVKYIDIQYMVEGSEVIACAPLALMTPAGGYDKDLDVTFGAVPGGGWAPLTLRPGELAVLYPGDAHAPRLPAGAPAPVVKVVIKAAV